MNISSISSNGALAQQAALQSQQTQQKFQQLAQEFQSGSVSPAQTAGLENDNLAPSLTTSTANAPAVQSGSSPVPSSPIRHHIHLGHHRPVAESSSNSDDGSDAQASDPFAQLGQPSSSTAVQAYSSLLPNQSALSSDLLGAQTASLESAALSVSA